MRIARTTLGAVYLLAPEWIPSVLGGRVDRRVSVVVRILGARHLAQAGLVSNAPRTWHPLAIGAGVDAVHAMSMVSLASADRRRRRLALADATVAAAFAAAGWRSAHQITESEVRAA